jgi:hypothetical protein
VYHAQIMASTSIGPNTRAQLIQIYNLYRTTLLNHYYYCDRLASFQRRNKIVEIAQALGTSSTLGAWSIFHGNTGKYVWIVIAGIATLISIIKPFLQWSKEIERYGQLSLGHTALYLDIKRLVERIAVDQEIRDTTVKEIDSAISRYKELALKDDLKPSAKKVEEFENRVNQQIRIKDLWRPPEK